MKYIFILAAVLFAALYYIIAEVIRQSRNRLFRRRLVIGVLIVALLLSQTSIVNIFTRMDAESAAASEVENAEIITISDFAELPDDIREQTVPVGTSLEELELPDTLEAVCVAAGVDADVDADTDDNTDIGDDADENTDVDADEGVDTDPEVDVDAVTDEDADTDTDADIDACNDADTNADTYTDTDITPDYDNTLGGGNTVDAEGNTEEAETYSVTMPEYQAENIIEVKTLEADSLSEDSKEAERSGIPETSEETIIIDNITWQSEPEYDGDVEGEYTFTAILPEGYVLTGGVNTPHITVTVGDNDDKEQTAKLLMTGWHYGEEDVYPQGNLFYDEEKYSFVLAGGSSETQIPFEEITDFLPTAVMAEFSYQSTEKENIAVENVEDAQEEVWEEILPIMGWSCPEYVQDEEGYLPYRGKFYFEAMLAEENNCEPAEGMTQPGVWVIFDEPMPLAAATPGIISSNQEWGEQTLPAGTYTINPGVTVTLTGEVTVSSKVTISGNGGGKIVRGSSDGLLYVKSGGNLTLADVEVDGNKVSSSRPIISVPSGSVTLDDGCWIHDCTKNTLKGGAVNIDGGTGVFNDILIENCSATSYGGGAYVYKGQLTINGGVYRNNSTSDSSTIWGGGFAFNNQGRLYIYGGSFLNNTSASRAGCIYSSSNNNTETYLYGGYFSGNKSSYPGYEGSGALNYSAVEDNDTILQISGDVQLVGDGEYGTDGLFLDISSNSSTFRKARISSQLQYPLPIYLNASEGYVIAEGVGGYELKESDMKKITFYDVNNSGKKWYAVLDKAKNQIYLSTTDPGYGLYVTYDGNGASGAVTDDTGYTSGDTVILKTATSESEGGFSYEGRTFIGWNTKADGTGTNYQPGDQVVITEDLYLYAQWAYSVTYVKNGGTITDESKYTSYTYGSELTLPEPTRTGYTFGGWFTGADFSGAAVSSISATDTGAKTYYAKWVDDIAPEITLSYSYEPIVFMDWVIGNKSLVITVHVTEEGSGADEIRYTVTGSGKGQGEDKTVALVNGEAKITADKDFKGTIKITCTDKDGNLSEEVTVGADLVGKDNVNGIIIEDHAPQISFTNGGEAISSSEYFEPDELNLTVSITDVIDDSGLDVISGGIASVTYQIGSKTEKSVDKDFKTEMVTTYNFTIPISELSTGTNKITVTVKDNAGNAAQSEFTVGIKGQEDTPNTGDGDSTDDDSGSTGDGGSTGGDSGNTGNGGSTGGDSGNTGTGDNTAGGTQTGTNTSGSTQTGSDTTDGTQADVQTGTGTRNGRGNSTGTKRSGTSSASSADSTDNKNSSQLASTDTTTNSSAGASTDTNQDAGQSDASGTDGQTTGSAAQIVNAELKDGQITIEGDVVVTGTVRTAETTTMTLIVGEGSVIVTVVSDEFRSAAGVANTVAVANAVLEPEQIQRVNNGETIEIRVDVKDISAQVSQEDKDIIESGLTSEGTDGEETEELTLGAYIDISMFIKIGDGDWNAITQSGEPIEVVIGIPEELQDGGRTYYIARAHEGEYALLEDLDDEADTITIRTGMFSTYAIVFRQAEGAGSRCKLCHICPTFLGICCFIWLAVIIVAIGVVIFVILGKRRKEEEAVS